MSELSLDDSTLVARELAALRKCGWTAGKALSLVADGLPQGKPREEMRSIATALEQGGAPPNGTGLLLSLLAQGEAAGPQSLLEAVRGYELEAEAQRAFRAATAFVLLLVCGCLAMLTVAGFVLKDGAPLRDMLGALPAQTERVLHLLSKMPSWGPILIGASVAIWAVLPRCLIPGVSGYRGAARLRQFAAAVDAGMTEAAALSIVDPARPASLLESKAMALDRYERHAVSLLLRHEGLSATARLIAEERQSGAVAAVARAKLLSPLLAAVAVAWVVGHMVAALYLPLFGLAGVLK